MKGKKTLLLSLATLCICTVLAVGGTYSLFTGEVTYNHVISAGKLKVEFKELSHTVNALDENGYMKAATTTHTTAKDLTATHSPIVLDKFVPQGYYETTLAVGNDGDTAFDYKLKFDVSTDGRTPSLELAEQIMVTITDVTVAGSPEVKKYIPLTQAQALDESFGTLVATPEGANDTRTYTVRFEFVDNDTINNSAQEGSVSIAVMLHATQRISE